MNWRKSSYSNQEGGHCLEVAEVVHPEGVRTFVRDTRNRQLARLDFPSPTWTAFLHAVKRDAM
ncbi:DUF397 domain-containing protein [Marinactinospora thermotolerans]|uniref:DUF397 domain-containing protein n=1 Tax=Marinactinospora thermotolerans DSM 45154 TaxID=1122192 RepID=A0A1T4THU6_9ACTN|nr:DUF397 domain-containing protein [Marinactinospora thermotolerans]SKA39789.1 protein of unknown function [Marinactinospora thermotolerans DSM 45154]